MFSLVPDLTSDSILFADNFKRHFPIALSDRVCIIPLHLGPIPAVRPDGNG